MDNATKKRLNAAMGKTWEYMTEVYTFKTWEEIDGTIFISTNTKTLEFDADMIEMSLAGLIEVAAKKNGLNGHSNGEVAVVSVQPIILQTMNAETQMSIAEGLRSVFDELSKAKSPETIRALSLKASNMVKITQAVTGMARLEFDLQKEARGRKVK